MATMNVSPPGTMKDWEPKEAIAALQAAITEGVASGAPEPFDATAFKLRMRERHGGR